MVTIVSRGRWFEPGSKDIFDNSPDDPDDYSINNREIEAGAVSSKCYNNTQVEWHNAFDFHSSIQKR